MSANKSCILLCWSGEIVYRGSSLFQYFWPVFEVQSNDLSLHNQPHRLSTSYQTRLIVPFSCDEDFMTSSSYWLSQLLRRVVYPSSKLLRWNSIGIRQAIIASLWKDTDRGKPRYWEKNICTYQTSHHKSQNCMKILMSLGFDFGYLTRPSWSKMKQMGNVYKI